MLSLPWYPDSVVITACKRSCEKVMLSVVSVSLLIGVPMCSLWTCSLGDTPSHLFKCVHLLPIHLLARERLTLSWKAFLLKNLKWSWMSLYSKGNCMWIQMDFKSWLSPLEIYNSLPSIIVCGIQCRHLLLQCTLFANKLNQMLKNTKRKVVYFVLLYYLLKIFYE